MELLGLDKVLADKYTIYGDSGKLPTETEAKVDPVKEAKDRKVKNLIKVCLSSDQILRKFMKQPTALAIWKKTLEKDYQVKALPNRIYLKQRFASIKMEEGKSIEENVDVFLKLIDDLEILNINISDED